MSKVLHISKFYFPDVGGIENTARDAVTALQSDGCQNKVICFNHEKGNVIDIIDEVEIIRCDCIAKFDSQPVSLSIIRELKRTIEEWKPDFVLLHWPNPYMAEFILRACKDEKIVVYWHSDIIKQRLLGKLFYGMSMKLLDKAYKIIVTSPNYIEGSVFLRKHREKCFVIPSCVNERRLEVSSTVSDRALKIREKNKGKIICLSVGRHVEYKGFEYLIKASRLLDDKYQFYISGDGPLTDKLKNEALGDEKIHFLGRIDNDTLKAFFVAADMFCFPSITKNEAFGLALAEAMYFSKPSVTFTIEGSGVNYVSVNRITGIEVDNRDFVGFANAVKEIGENVTFREVLSKNAKTRADKLFSYTYYSDLLKQVIH